MENSLNRTGQEFYGPLVENGLPQLPPLAPQQSPVVQKRQKNPLMTLRGILLCIMVFLVVGAGVVFVIIKDQVPLGREKWSHQIGGNRISSPTVANGMVYVGNDENTIYALDEVSGHVIWSNQLGNYTDAQASTRSGIVPSVVVVNGVAYANSQNNYLYALEARTGRNLWSSEMPYVAMSPPIVANDIVYIGDENGTLHAFNAVSGKKIWSVQRGSFFFFDNVSPTLDKGMIYVAGFEGKVYALEAASGREKWHSSIRGSDVGSCSPIVVNGTVYVSTTSGQLAAFDAITGREKWTVSQLGGFTSSPVVVGNMIYVYSFSGVFAWDTASGHKQWFHSMSDAGTFSALAGANGTVYAGTADRMMSANGGIQFQSDNKLYALDAVSGNEQWYCQLGGGSAFSTPMVSNGAVYVGADDGKVYALLPPE